MRKINEAGFDLIRDFEGLRLNAYQDSVGVWTIGFGSTKGVKRGQRITEEEAEELLREDLSTAESGVENALTEDVTDNQFAACVSLAFNVGVGAFRKSSIVKYINSGDALLAADRFLLYNKAKGKTLAGLTRRRKAERALFLKDDEPHTAPIKNGTVEEAPTASSTEVTKVTSVEKTAEGTETKETTFVEKIASNDKIKEIASTGMSAIGTRAANTAVSAGTGATIWAFITGNWIALAAGVIFIVGGIFVWRTVYKQRQRIKELEAVINSDKDRADVKFK